MIEKIRSRYAAETRKPPRPMYGQVVRVPDGKGYAFAQSEGLEIFVHFSHGRKICGHRKNSPWLIQENKSTVPNPKVGDHLFMQVVPGKTDPRTGRQGYRALLWAHDPRPLPFNYGDIVTGWQAFTKMPLTDDLELSPLEQTQASEAARRYLNHRLNTLVYEPANARPDDCCLRWAKLELRFMAEIAERLDLAVDVAGRLSDLKQMPEALSPTNPVERLIRDTERAMEEGRPCSAEKMLGTVFEQEKVRLDLVIAELKRKHYGWYEPSYQDYRELQRMHCPVTHAFQERALAGLSSKCYGTANKKRHALISSVQNAYNKGKLDEVSRLWHEMHAHDPEFEADADFESIIKEWCTIGAFELVEMIGSLLDERYTKSLQIIKQELPEKTQRRPDRFAHFTRKIREAASKGGCAMHLLKLYDKHIVKPGLEQAFLRGTPERAKLVQDLREILPLEKLRSLTGEIGGEIEEDIASLEAALNYYDQVKEGSRHHPLWRETEMSVLWAEMRCKKYEAAHQRLIDILQTYDAPDNPELIREFHVTWTMSLCRENNLDQIEPMLSRAEKLFPEQINGPKILEDSLSRMYRWASWELIQKFTQLIRQLYPETGVGAGQKD